MAYVNMSQPGATCPQGLEQQQINGSTYCGRFTPGPGCLSARINKVMTNYSQVCGRVAGYQYNSPNAFWSYLSYNLNIDQVYFDGLSIMYGIPRKHIWTYTAGFTYFNLGKDSCPCNHGNRHLPPLFVGSDYYCESGRPSGTCSPVLFSNDTLWDGQHCGGREAPCCTQPNMPWFLKTLNETTTEDIELRACTSSDGCDGNVPVYLIELYVC